MDVHGIRDGQFTIDSDVLYQFDEYRYFGPTQGYEAFSDAYILDGKDSNGLDKAKRNPDAGKDDGPVKARKSLFNNINNVRGDDTYRQNLNIPLFDSPETRKTIKQKTGCTIKELVDASKKGEMGRAIYTYADFMFCTDLGKMPNNHLITLRRFSTGCGDVINNIDATGTGHTPDIGRLVAWFGVGDNSLDKLLQYNVSLNWKALNAQIEEQQGSDGGGALKKLFQSCDSSYQAQVIKGQQGKAFQESMGGLGSWTNWDAQGDRAKYLTNYDNNRVYGPVDVIDKTQKRDRGLNYTHSYNITFDYTLRSYDGINGKAAFLDLLANVLAVCYQTGKFWGGARKNSGARQNNFYANLPIFQWGENGGKGGIGGFVDASIDSISQVWSKVVGSFSSVSAAIDTIKKVGGGLASMFAAGMLNKLGRPDKFAWQSLLQEIPVGYWHITVGNPRNPILQEGNLIMKDCKISHYGPLGIDDFPTGLKIEVSLEPAMPRDITKIEQLYTMGDARIYTPMGPLLQKTYDGSKRVKSTTHTHTGSKDKSEQAQSDVSNEKISENNIDPNASWLTQVFGMAANAKDALVIIANNAMEAQYGNYDPDNKNKK